MEIVDFLEARIREDEERTRPKTVSIRSVGPNPDVAICFGGMAGCSWILEGGPEKGWWKAQRHVDAIRSHEWTHADTGERATRARCEMMRKAIAHYKRVDWDSEPVGDQDYAERFLFILAGPYAEHRDCQMHWGY
jgi:hypothetical protein